MKKDNLPISWIRWRRRRCQRLVAEGLPRRLAWEIAAGEAKGRHRIAQITGNQAARDATLVWISIGGKARFMLTGGFAGLTVEQIASIEELNSRIDKAA